MPPEGDGQGQGSGQEQGSEQQGQEQQGAKGGSGQEETFDKDRALSTIRAQRESEAALKKQLADAQAKVKKFEDDQLSEKDRLSKQVAEHEQANAQLKQQLQDTVTVRAIERAAAKAGFVDPEDAVLTVNRSTLKLEDDGTPTADSLKKALEDLAKAKPHLIGGKNTGSWDGGARKTPPTGTDMDSWIRQQAGHA